MLDGKKIHRDRPATFQVHVQGCIKQRWVDWFDGMTITSGDDDNAPVITTLTGTLPDQAALLGLLQKLDTLGLALLLVRREEASWTSDATQR